jgi:dihydroorotase-like cyclic amidohydrolase
MSYDLVIRNGTVVDGLGGEPYRGDVAVSGGVIVAVGTVDTPGTREIDATGLLVTPGFVDLHCHLREPGGQASETIESGTASAAAGTPPACQLTHPK